MKYRLSPASLVLCFFLALGMLCSCAGMQVFDTGLPASAGKKFFFQMNIEATQRGYSTFKGMDGNELLVTVPKGTLNYNIDEGSGSIQVLVSLANTKNVPEAEVQAGIKELKALSDEMIDGARARAEAAKAFE